MRKFLLIFLVLINLIFFFPSIAFASSYVLPYPSVMPGGIQYKIHLAWEKVLHYWYFGNFGQFEYSLKESDKYLVEAKTLFEYDQFFLGYKALEKSNMYFAQTYPYLMKAKKNGKDISEKRQIFHDASLKHIEVLKKLLNETPPTFLWQPEKSIATNLNIQKAITEAIKQRMQDL